jgi:hypothetical protein
MFYGIEIDRYVGLTEGRSFRVFPKQMGSIAGIYFCVSLRSFVKNNINYEIGGVSHEAISNFTLL